MPAQPAPSPDSATFVELVLARIHGWPVDLPLAHRPGNFSGVVYYVHSPIALTQRKSEIPVSQHAGCLVHHRLPPRFFREGVPWEGSSPLRWTHRDPDIHSNLNLFCMNGDRLQCVSSCHPVQGACRAKCIRQRRHGWDRDEQEEEEEEDEDDDDDDDI